MPFIIALNSKLIIEIIKLVIARKNTNTAITLHAFIADLEIPIIPSTNIKIPSTELSASIPSKSPSKRLAAASIANPRPSAINAILTKTLVILPLLIDISLSF
jgi:hypothetical protein